MPYQQYTTVLSSGLLTQKIGLQIAINNKFPRAPISAIQAKKLRQTI